MSYIERPWSNMDDAEACMYTFRADPFLFLTFFCVAMNFSEAKGFQCLFDRSHCSADYLT